MWTGLYVLSQVWEFEPHSSFPLTSSSIHPIEHVGVDVIQVSVTSKDNEYAIVFMESGLSGPKFFLQRIRIPFLC